MYTGSSKNSNTMATSKTRRSPLWLKSCAMQVTRKREFDSSSGHQYNCISPNVEESLQKKKRTKKGKQMEITSNPESKTLKVRPEWPQFSQEKLRVIFGPRPRKMMFVFEDSDDSEDDGGCPVEECKQTYEKEKKRNKDEEETSQKRAKLLLNEHP